MTLLRCESQRTDPDGERLGELALAVLSDLAADVRTARNSNARSQCAYREELLRRLARAERLVQARAAWQLDGAADAATPSTFHLIRMFQAVYGQTPLAWASGNDSFATYRAAHERLVEAIARHAGYEATRRPRVSAPLQRNPGARTRR